MSAPPVRAATAEGQAGLDAILADPAHALIASDFDGTLSPIVADPASALAAPGAARRWPGLARPSARWRSSQAGLPPKRLRSAALRTLPG